MQYNVRKLQKFTLTAVLLFCLAFAKAQLNTFQTATNDFLNSYVEDGLVSYEAIYDNPVKLKKALNALKKIDIKSLELKEREAVWINAYNLFIIKGIVDAYPIQSVTHISDFFDEQQYELGNKLVSLNQLEKEILFKEVWDERLHFVLVCGALGCPPLTSKAFTATNLELMLQRLTRKAINNPNIVKLDMHEKKALVSKIFEWYKPDFIKRKTLIEYINTYRDDKIPDGFTVEFQEYDWNLNSK